MSDTQRLVTAQELKNHLHIDIQTIYMKCKREGLPHMRTGRKYLFNLDEVIVWLKSRQVKNENQNQ